MDEFFRSVGMIVCVVGGGALSIALVGLAIVWAAEKHTSAAAVYRIAKHARQHGLDLRTGKPLCPDCRGAGEFPAEGVCATCGGKGSVSRENNGRGAGQ